MRFKRSAPRSQKFWNQNKEIRWAIARFCAASGRSADNLTTVIAVRGTLDYLDLLHDVSLWLVPALLQIFGCLGLDVSFGPWGMAMSTLSELVPMAHIDRGTTFRSVLLATKFMMKKYPERHFYLTGHSLGGGIAKLVHILLDVPSVKVQTVAFSAPGIHYAAHVLMGAEGWVDLHAKFERRLGFALTVRPTHDIISKIDFRGGSTNLRIPCQSNALQCHSLYHTLWSILHICGAPEPLNLTVPLAWSPKTHSLR